MSLNYASLLHVLSLSSLLPNSSRLDRRLDNHLITSARRADVSLLARPTHVCTCYCGYFLEAKAAGSLSGAGLPRHPSPP